VVLEKGWQSATGNVAAFVDRGRQYRPTVFTVPDGVVGTTTKERYTKRSSGDDHVFSLPLA
jgi:hypothetical protein